MAGEVLLPDDDLSNDLRDHLAEFTTPRTGVDGQRYWLIDEVAIEASIAEIDPIVAHALALADELSVAEEREDYEDEADHETDTPPTSPPPIGSAPNDEEALEREVARRQAARLVRVRSRASRPTNRPSRWAHVPLAELFAQAGNRLYTRGSGLVECGHEPIHTSRGGRCVEIDSTTGLLWCRSCREGGDAVSFVLAVQGCTREEAEAVLFLQYGPPQTSTARPRKRVISVELP
jgi:hypothetical protein